MAAAFIREMRMVQPHGPYQLSGYSFGGIIAYEMAQQLVKAGEEVPVLVFFDTYDPREYLAVAKREAPLHLPLKVGVVRRMAEFIFNSGHDLPVKLRHTYIIDTYNRAINNYKVRPYDGRITLLRTSDSTGPVDMGWADLARGGVDVRSVPGNHYNMVKEPHVAALAEELKRCVDAHLRERTTQAG
jgi:thioesterase domain-containing protein